jgi:hypothetical protein
MTLAEIARWQETAIVALILTNAAMVLVAAVALCLLRARDARGVDEPQHVLSTWMRKGAHAGLRGPRVQGRNLAKTEEAGAHPVERVAGPPR